MPHSLPNLPLDISTFSTLRESGYLYVDKTEGIYRLLTQKRRVFLSSPRRFGKSLLVSTFDAMLKGEKQWFDGLWVSKSNYSWTPHGIISLDFSNFNDMNVETLNERLCFFLIRIANQVQVELSVNPLDPILLLTTLVDALRKKFTKVAALIEEYDSPILQTGSSPHEAMLICNYIENFFTSIKSLDAQIDFVFVTGVSSFAKAGLSSGSNNFQNITSDPSFATLCD